MQQIMSIKLTQNTVT